MSGLPLSALKAAALLALCLACGAGEEDDLGLPPLEEVPAAAPAPKPPAEQSPVVVDTPRLMADGFTGARIRQTVLVLVALGLCGAWFSLVARTHKLRGAGDSRTVRIANTVSFVTLGVPAFAKFLRDKGIGVPGGSAGASPRAKKGKAKKGKKGEAEPEEDKVVFLSSEGFPRDPGTGDAVTTSKDVIHGAITREATDIHLEPKGEEMQVRYRVDGDLYTATTYGADLAQPLIASLKVAAEMDIAERRRSQDGSFKATVKGRTIDFRVSTAPSAFGEKMVIRVLDKARGVRRLENLGFQPGILEQIRKIIHQPHGMFLVCGPTGSGKSTTLYAGLSEMDATRKNIITIENPIEYHLPNVTQTQINEKAGVTFASVLRSSLRQDPNVLMIGEIRDTETAQVGLQAAMTGHLVFSTVHANDSVSSVFRLLDLGVEPFMLSSALSGVLAQRLIKMLCPACKQPYSPKPEFIALARKRGIEVTHFYKPVGCDKCSGQGYRGRLGAFELLVMNDTLRSMIQAKPTLTDLHAAAKQAGLVYLREDALIKASQGLTSVEQVLSLTTV